MLHFLNNLKYFPAFVLCAIFIISCDEIDHFIDEIEQFINDFDIKDYVNLEPIGISIEPKNGEVLSNSFSPVIIKFDTKMEKNLVEYILNVNSDSETLNGDKIWIDNDLHFVPDRGWTAGIRYYLNFTGTIRSIDGRTAKIENFLSFYALTKNNPPLLESYTPANGESIKTNNFILELNFSQSMDKLSVETSVNIEGFGDKIFEWSDNNKKLLISSDKALSPWMNYRWSLKDSAKSLEGIPIAKAYSGNFITDFDQILPEITSIYPVEFHNGSWYPSTVNMDIGLNIGQSIAVSFNKPMSENVLRSLRFEPSLQGKAEKLSENSIVFIFSKDPEPETTYTLIVSGDTQDTEGLKIGDDFKTNIYVNVPYLKIISITANDGIIYEDFSNINNVIRVTASQAADEVSLTIKFSLFIDDINDKKTIPQQISISQFFPKTISPVNLIYTNWSSQNLYMKWEGFSASDLSADSNYVPHYYKLKIPGGKDGITCGNGFYMKEDFIILLEVVK